MYMYRCWIYCTISLTLDQLWRYCNQSKISKKHRNSVCGVVSGLARRELNDLIWLYLYMYLASAFCLSVCLLVFLSAVTEWRNKVKYINVRPWWDSWLASAACSLESVRYSVETLRWRPCQHPARRQSACTWRTSPTSPTDQQTNRLRTASYESLPGA